MKCPYCNKELYIEWDESLSFQDIDGFECTEIQAEQCPSCNQLIVRLISGTKMKGTDYLYVNTIQNEKLVYPKSYSRPIENEVPDFYKEDYKEACTVINISPKASAALSRRLLQKILHEEYNISKNSLAQEIEIFINLPGIPSHITEAVDSVRNIGNFAAHPIKDTNTGEIVDVESGEAEWLLEVLEAMFDFVFVQPIRLQEKKDKLNEKLNNLRKPPMKG
jgi:hypothetical protein